MIKTNATRYVEVGGVRTKVEDLWVPGPGEKGGEVWILQGIDPNSNIITDKLNEPVWPFPTSVRS